MGTTMVMGVKFYVQECCNCGMSFAVPKDFDERRREDHKSFHCPNGHSQAYTGKNKEARLKAQLKFVEKEHEQCMLNLKRKVQDLTLAQLLDKEKLSAKGEHYVIHIEHRRQSGEVGYLCGYGIYQSEAVAAEGIGNDQWLCLRCIGSLESREREKET